MKKIAPSILSCNFAKMEDEIRKVEAAGVEMLHIDVMDGHFVKNLTVGLPIIEAIRGITKLQLDVHLMIDNPDEYIDDYLNAGADTISFHVETVAREKSRRKISEGYTVILLDEPILDEEKYLFIVEKIRKAGKKACLAYNPSTMLEIVDPVFIKKLDMILIMTVWPGFGGQKFINPTEEKIKNARKNFQEIDIEVDGGINSETAKIALRAGANVFVAGTYIFKSNNIASTIKELRSIIS
ncbi:MAG: ribulose-phosphate 3-epimerase [Planctomycetes bacterium]|nr:ribulose-phosphate 3-epimerase [Planctomycetota bacterium]